MIQKLKHHWKTATVINKCYTGKFNLFRIFIQNIYSEYLFVIKSLNNQKKLLRIYLISYG